MKPYYEHAGITIYHGDCGEILPSIDESTIDLVLTDPPYGIALNADYATSRGIWKSQRATRGHRAWPGKKHKPIHGDNEPFDPAILSRFKGVVLFGANNYADKLPPQYSWLVWDKKTERGAKSSYGDCELAYCRGAKFNSVRIFRHMWCGYQRDSEVGEGSKHPTQKPVALMQWCMTFFDKVITVLDPYMGCGTTLVAAKRDNRKAIGIEIEESYCEIAAKRLAQEVFSFEDACK